MPLFQTGDPQLQVYDAVCPRHMSQSHTYITSPLGHSRNERPTDCIKPHPRNIEGIDDVKVRIDVGVKGIMAHSTGETVAVGLTAVVLRGLFIEVGLRIECQQRINWLL